MHRFKVLFLFILFCFSTLYCSGFTIHNAPVTTFDSFLIQSKVRNLHIKGSLVFLKEKKPVAYRSMKQIVRNIRYSYYYHMSYPYFDTIYISEFSLSRGDIYGASVLYHEFHHVLFNMIRRKPQIRKNKIIRNYLTRKKISIRSIHKLSKENEERILYHYQLDFLLQYGSKDDIEYQRLKMRAKKVFMI